MCCLWGSGSHAFTQEAAEEGFWEAANSDSRCRKIGKEDTEAGVKTWYVKWKKRLSSFTQNNHVALVFRGCTAMSTQVAARQWTSASSCALQFRPWKTWAKWLGTLLRVLPVVSQLGKSRWEELAGSNTAGKHAAHAVLHSQSKGAPTLVFELSSRASFLVILSYWAFIHFVEYLRDHSLCSFEISNAGTGVVHLPVGIEALGPHCNQPE